MFTFHTSEAHNVSMACDWRAIAEAISGLPELQRIIFYFPSYEILVQFAEKWKGALTGLFETSEFMHGIEGCGGRFSQIIDIEDLKPSLYHLLSCEFSLTTLR